MHTSNDELKQRAKQLLNNRRRKRPDDPSSPVTAHELAVCIGLAIGKCRETRRRAARQLVADLRAEGFAIASNNDGCWVAENEADHRIYQDYLKTMGLKHLVSEAQDRRSQSQADADGQLGLFPDVSPSRTHI